MAYKELSTYLSDDGKKEAIVYRCIEERDYRVSVKNDSGTTFVTAFESQEVAENYAEDWCYNTFCTKIFYDTIITDNRSIIDSILTIKSEDTGTHNSNMGGWQSTYFEENSHKFVISLFNEIKNKVSDIYNELSINSECNISNYWFNINRKYDYNISHAHAFSYMSAVYYLKVPVNSGKIVFKRPDRLRETVPFKHTTENNYGIFWLTPKEGDVIIFPSFLEHYVEQNLTEETDDRRITIAINFR